MPTKAGRPLKLNKTVQQKITDAISIGTPLKAAARCGGICYETFNNWYKTGQEIWQRLLDADDKEAERRIYDGLEPEDKSFLKFFHQVEEAKANAGVSWANVINNAAAVDPKWASFMLEKWFPEDYDQAQRVEVSGKVQTEDVTFTDEARIERLTRLLDKLRERRDRQADSGD